MKAIRSAGICAFLVLVLAGSSPGDTFTHDGVTFYCSPTMKNTFRSFGPGLAKNSYRFVRFCKTAGYGDEGNNVDQHEITYECSWDAATGKATEVVNNEFTYYYMGQVQNIQNYQNTLTADCAADPWLNDIDCTNPMKGPQYANDWAFDPPYPISAEMMDPSVRKYLKNQANNVIRELPPEVLLPKPNGKFTNGQLVFEGRSTIPDEDSPSSWEVEIELNMDQSQPGAQNVPLTDHRRYSGLGTAWIYRDLPYNGFWFVRARSTSPNHTGKWSGQVRFEIAGSKGLQLTAKAIGNLNAVQLGGGVKPKPPTLVSPTPDQVITGSGVKVQASVPSGSATSKIDLEFERNTKPPQAVPLWEKASVVGGYDTSTSPAGITVGKGQFPALGRWRVKARLSVPNAPWSAPVTFELKEPAIDPSKFQKPQLRLGK